MHVARFARVPCTAPKRRGSRNRSTNSSKIQSMWSCFAATGTPAAGSTRSVPVMPRWTMNQPASTSNSRYLPRRSTARTSRARNCSAARRHGPAQHLGTDVDTLDAAARDKADAPARDFDFWQLWHVLRV